MKRLVHILKSKYFYYYGIAAFLFLLSLNLNYFFILFILFLVAFRKNYNKIIIIIVITLTFLVFYFQKQIKIPKEVSGKFLVTEKEKYFNNYSYIIKKGNIKYLIVLDAEINVGNYLNLSGETKGFVDLSSPNGFAKSDYYLNKGVYAEIINFKVDKTDKNNVLYYFYSKVSNREINSLFFDEPKEEVSAAINNLNIYYLIGLSGIHVYFLIRTIKKIMFYLNVNNYMQDLVQIITILILLLITGFKITIIRILIYYLLKIIKKYYYPNITNYSLLQLTFLLLIIMFPYLTVSYSFMVSYLLVNFITLFSVLFNDSSFIVSNIKLTFFINLFLIPFSSTVNLIGVVLNPLLIFVFVLILFPIELINLIFQISSVNKVTNAFKTFLISLGKINLNIFLPKLPVFLTLIFLVVLIKFLVSKKKITYFLMLLIIIIIPSFKRYVNSPKLYFLDVGQGDASVYISAESVVVIDCFKSVERLLRYEGINQIDYLILTHSDFDHVNEANSLISNFRVKNVIINDFDSYNLINNSGIIKITSETKIKLKDLTLHFLKTQPVDNKTNNNSLVFTLSFADTKVLYTGDIERELEYSMIKKYGKTLKSDIIKVPHHGSITSSSPEFIELVAPRYAIISVSKENNYNMPSKVVINNYELFGSKVYRTDLDGTILYYKEKIYFK